MNSSDEKLKQYRFIFGLSENYSREELRSAYATLARLNHPDKNPGADSLAKMVIINEAYLVMQEGTSNKEDIDTAMKLGTNYPFGPIEWSEKLGVELVYNILASMLNEFGEDRYRITPLLREASISSRITS